MSMFGRKNPLAASDAPDPDPLQVPFNVPPPPRLKKIEPAKICAECTWVRVHPTQPSRCHHENAKVWRDNIRGDFPCCFNMRTPSAVDLYGEEAYCGQSGKWFDLRETTERE